MFTQNIEIILGTKEITQETDYKALEDKKLCFFFFQKRNIEVILDL